MAGQEIVPMIPFGAVYPEQGHGRPRQGMTPYEQGLAPVSAMPVPTPYAGNPYSAPRIEDLRDTHAQLLTQHRHYEARIKALEAQGHNGHDQQNPNVTVDTINTDHRSHPFKKTTRSSVSRPVPLGPPTEAEAAAEAPGDWVGISNNAYGAFIHQAFHVEVITWNGALVQYGPMVVVSFLVQTSIVYELWRELPKTRNPEFVCNLHSNLQLAAMGVFLLVTFENIPKMYNAMMITLYCKNFREKGTKGEGTPHVRTLKWKRRTTMFIFAVLTEFVAWFSILSVGIIWLLSAVSHENIIRTTVAITFVNNVDEFVYSGCVTPARQDEHGKYEYHVGVVDKSRSVKEGIQKMFDAYYTHFHLITITGIACGIVYGVRVSDVQCDPN